MDTLISQHVTWPERGGLHCSRSDHGVQNLIDSACDCIHDSNGGREVGSQTTYVSSLTSLQLMGDTELYVLGESTSISCCVAAATGEWPGDLV